MTDLPDFTDHHAVIAAVLERIAPKRCPRCKGQKTIYQTDGAQIWCPTCGGAGEVDEYDADERVLIGYAGG